MKNTASFGARIAKSVSLVSLVTLLSSLGIYNLALAAVEKQWPSNASPGDIIISNNPPDETDQQLAKTSDGDYVVVFLLNGRPFALKISATDGSGVAAWNGGFPVIASTSVGTPIEVVPDNAGGVYLSWNTDLGGGDCDVFLQRIDSTGTIQYGGGGVNITTGSGCESYMQMIPDGSGGVYIVWGNGGPNTNTFQSTDLYVTRMDSAGTVNASWNTGGAGTWRPLQLPEVSASASNEHSASLVSDGLGNIIVTYSSDTGSFFYVATKFDANGTIAGFPWSIPAPVASDNNGNLGRHVLSDGNGNIFTAYLTGPFGSPTGIEVQKIDSSGFGQWGGGDGVTVSTTDISGYSGQPRIALDGSGGVIVAWQTAGSDFEIYSHHVTSAGALDTSGNWASAPIALSDTTQDTSWFQSLNRNSVLSDGAGGAYVLYGSYEGGSYAVSKLQHIESDGTVEFSGDGTTVGVGAGIEGVQSVMTSDGSTGVVVAFQDETGSGLDLYAQYFDEVAGGGGGGGSNQTGNLPIECDTTNPSFNLTPESAVTFSSDGSGGTVYSQTSAQQAYNNPNGSPLTVTTANDFISVVDVRDPSACNDGLTLTLDVIDGTDGDGIYFDSVPAGAGGDFLPLTGLYYVTSSDTCPAGYTENNTTGVCVSNTALCGDGDNNAAVTCDNTHGITIADYTGTDFATLATYTTDGDSALGTGDNTPASRDVLTFTDGKELYGEAGVAVSYGLNIPANQVSGTYVVELQYTLSPTG